MNGSSHRYDSVGGVPLEYDGEGNLTFDGAYYYDFKNRLSEVLTYVPIDGEQPLSGSLSGRTTASSRPRYLVPRERLARIYLRGRDRFAAAARTRDGLRNMTGSSALADQNNTTAATEGNLELVAMYTYDPHNRRVMRMLAGQPILYSTWDGWREVAEYQYIGAPGMPWLPIRNFVWGGRIDELIRFSVASWNGQQIVWTHYHPQQDHQDSVDMLVQGDGTPKEKYEYDPFGGVKVWTASGSNWTHAGSTSSVGNPYLYTGRRRDPETKLYYYRNRYYCEKLGRFLTADPVGNWQDRHAVGNGYVYAANVGTDFEDPLGFQVREFPPFFIKISTKLNEKHAERIDDVERAAEAAADGRDDPSIDDPQILSDKLAVDVGVGIAKKIGASLGRSCWKWAKDGFKGGPFDTAFRTSEDQPPDPSTKVGISLDSSLNDLGADVKLSSGNVSAVLSLGLDADLSLENSFENVSAKASLGVGLDTGKVFGIESGRSSLSFSISDNHGEGGKNEQRADLTFRIRF